MDRAFILQQIETTKAQIIAYQGALTAFAAGIQSYTIDTGQTRQVVTRADIGSIKRLVSSLMNQCVMLEARANGGNQFEGRPRW